MAEKKEKKTLTGGLLTLWQFVKFMAASLIGGVTQILLQYLLPLIFDRVRTPIPHWLDFLYHPESMFDTATAKGAAEYAKYIINDDGILRVTWGYVLSFFLANILVNIGLYIWNKKKTFKSNAAEWHFVVYFVIMVLTIVFSTWMQGALYAPLYAHMGAFTRTFLLIPVGVVQTAVFFVAQKLLLPPEDQNVQDAYKIAKKAEKTAKSAEKALAKDPNEESKAKAESARAEADRLQAEAKKIDDAYKAEKAAETSKN